ncbi:MAG: hypothetical protein IJI23_05030 [Lachnospiraceae bacterium]|nr:hypothetical protein [Lachnospiraceae bacterium]
MKNAKQVADKIDKVAKVRIFYDAIKSAENKKSPVIKKVTVSPKTARNKLAAKVYV